MFVRCSISLIFLYSQTLAYFNNSEIKGAKSCGTLRYNGIVVSNTKRKTFPHYNQHPTTTIRMNFKNINGSKYYHFTRFYEDIPDPHPSAELLFSQIGRDCTTYYFGEHDFKENLLSVRFHDICIHDLSGYCVQIITSLGNIPYHLHFQTYPWVWTDFNYQFRQQPNSWSKDTDLVRNRFRNSRNSRRNGTLRINPKFINLHWSYYKIFGFGSAPKYGTSCLTLVRNTYNIMSTESENPHHNQYELFQMPFNGRISPNFVFVYTYQCDMCRMGLDYMRNTENVGSSIILIVTRIKLYLLRYHGLLKNITHNHELLNVLELQKLWRKYNSRVELFYSHYFSNATKKPYLAGWNDSLNYRICGGTPLVRYYYMSREISKSERILDPQEDCVYETILAKRIGHRYADVINFANTSFHWPFQSDYGAILQDKEDSSTFPVGKFGLFYISISSRSQGFHYNIFLEKKQIKVEFDMTSLLRPFHYIVWATFVGALCILSILLKIACKSFQIFWLYGVMLEKEMKIPKTYLKRFVVVIIAGTWLLTTIILRQFYTGEMFSAVTSEKTPHTPKCFVELLDDKNYKKYDVFVPAEQAEALIWGDRQNSKFSSAQLWSVTNGLNRTQLLDIIDRDIHPPSFFQTRSNIETKKYPRIALITYTNPSKIQSTTPPRFEGDIVSRKWVAPYPYESILDALGKRKLIPNQDEPIKNYPWMYHGKRNYFSETFQKDLSSLIESGIYGRWEYYMCKFSELQYILEENPRTLNYSWNFYHAACRKLEGAVRVPLSFKKVSNLSIRVIWVLFVGCIALSSMAYLGEVVRFDIPGRKCRCLGCGNVVKYKKS